MPDESANWTWRSTATAAVARHDDIWFFDENVGWAVYSSGHVIRTVDGGRRWDRNVTLQNFSDGAVLKMVDGGQPWTRKHFNDSRENRSLEDVGFINETTGWVGGWHLSSASEDGGDNWRDANEVGRHINRFRFIGNPVRAGYASGSQVYRYGPDAAAMAEAAPLASRLLRTDGPTRSGRPLTIRIEVPRDAGRLKVDIWDSFSAHVCKLTDEAKPKSGPREIEWDCCSESGETVADDFCCYRVVVDDESESRIVKIGEG